MTNDDPANDLDERWRERHDMEIESIQARLNLFLRGLDVEGMLCLRRILNCDRESPSNNYFAGRIDSLLDVIHHVNNAQGMTEAEELAIRNVKKERA